MALRGTRTTQFDNYYIPTGIEPGMINDSTTKNQDDSFIKQSAGTGFLDKKMMSPAYKVGESGFLIDGNKSNINNDYYDSYAEFNTLFISKVFSPRKSDGVPSGLVIDGNSSSNTNTQGGSITVSAGFGTGNQAGGAISIVGGIGGSSNGAGGNASLAGGSGGNTNSNGGDVFVAGGASKGTGIGGDVILTAGSNQSGTDGVVKIEDPTSGIFAKFNTSSLASSDKTFTFPNQTGVIATITSGSGAPGSTPAAVGQIYVDTSGAKVYISTGTSSSSDWSILN